jgi:pimeloyl-ACP methyl ester carboxylesterase
VGEIQAHEIATGRLSMKVLTSGNGGSPILFLHGNVSSSAFWRDLLAELPQDFFGIAPDLRGYGDTQALPIDARRGLRDWSDDVEALREAMGLGGMHIVGWSLGGGIAMQYAIDHPGRVRSLTLESPLSPYGFGGTKGAGGSICFPDGAGSGGGSTNPEYMQRLRDGDRGQESPFSPRNVMNQFYFKPPFRVAPEMEELLVTEMLKTRLGDHYYPGDLKPTQNWPGLAPGEHGVNNAMAPIYCNLSALAEISPKPPVLWVRGADDQISSDHSLLDFGTLGQLGAVPGWPGVDAFPPQPMISQTRAVLDRYRTGGGSCEEVLLPDCGHAPHIEHAATFRRLLEDFLHRKG